MENQLVLYKRLNIYQKERFPILANGLMITAFTFSAISYSRICRGVDGFIGLKDFLIGVLTTFTLFVLVRIFDEFKDKEEDAKFRSYLPVPRGLVKLSELKTLGWILVLFQLSVLIIFQSKMLLLWILVLAYLLLMSKEFFIADWLKKNQIPYILSHMIIIPLIDLYSSGLDWLLGSDNFHAGVVWFMAVSFFNGIVLEFGRKIRAPKAEEDGVLSYTKLYGTKKAVILWICLLMITASLAIGAMLYANYGTLAIIILVIFLMVCSVPGVLFIKNTTIKNSKYIEYSSGIWTALMYLSLGAIPMIKNFLV